MGFSFRGVHSNSFKWLGVRTIHNEILPEPKTITVESDFIDGDYDFSESSGRLKYNTRIFEKEIFLVGESLTNLNEKIRELINWLCGGYADLILDENPNLIWKAKISNQIDLEPQLKRAGKATIYFKAQPFGRGKDKISIKIDGSAKFTNDNWYVKPILTIEGACSDLKVKLNDTTITYPTSVSEKMIIDYEKMTVNVDGSNVTAKSYGDFGEVTRGENSIYISASGTYNAKLEYYPLYFW